MATGESSACLAPQQPARVRFISVEPIIFLIVTTQGIMTTARVQYVQKRLTEEYNYTLPNAQQNGGCSQDNITADAIELRIQSETSLWVMWMSALSTMIPILTGTILVAASDVVGRKPILILSAIGHIVPAAILVAVAILKLPFGVMLLAKAILGVFGDSATPRAVGLAYIADSTADENLAVKMAIFEFASNAGWGFGKLLVSIVLQETFNFTLGFGCALVISLFCFAYTACPGVLLETLTKTEYSRITLADIVKDTLQGLGALCGPPLRAVRWQIFLVLAILVLVFIVTESIFVVAIIVGLGKPFCWQPLTVGLYEFVCMVLPVTVAALLSKPLLRYISEYWLIHLGVLSFSGQLITMALARTTFQLAYLAPIIGSFRTFPAVLAMFVLSTLVTKEQQGTAFAAFSFIICIGSTISPLIINGIYSATVTIGFPRLVFYVSLIFMGLVTICTGILQILPGKQKDEEENIELQNSDFGS